MFYDYGSVTSQQLYEECDLSEMFVPDDGGLQKKVQWGVWEANGEEQAVPEAAGAVWLSEAAQHGCERWRKRHTATTRTTKLQRW